MTTAATTGSPITVPSQALGAIEVRPESVITMAEPLAGFPDTTQYALIEHTRAAVRGLLDQGPVWKG